MIRSAGFRVHSDNIVILLVFAAALLVAWPVGNFPLNDDWTYAHSLLALNERQVLDLGTSSASLVTHLFYGLVFIKSFGFSFTVLRISTWCSVAISVFALNNLLKNLDCSRPLRLFTAGLLLFNPLYFSLANTYMTDVNFCSLLLLCMTHGLLFYLRRSALDFTLFFVFSVLLTMLRQFGLFLPISFTIGCLFLTNRWKSLMAAASATTAVYLVFHAFETSEAARFSVAYQSSAGTDLTSPEFWASLNERFIFRLQAIVANVALWSFPVLCVCLVKLVRLLRLKISLALIAVALVAAFLVKGDHNFVVGNVFANMTLGAETFYQSLIWPGNPFPHTYSAIFHQVLTYAQLLSLSLLFSVLLLLAAAFAKKLVRFRFLPFAAMCAIFAACYCLALILPAGFLDRYFLPLLIVFWLLLYNLDLGLAPDLKFFVFLLPFVYVSVTGTRDYFEMNRQKWMAYEHLRRELHVSLDKLNGGYEVNGWYEGQMGHWYDYAMPQNHTYFIQYTPEPGFIRYRAFPFTRWFPPRNDTIFIFKRGMEPAR